MQRLLLGFAPALLLLLAACGGSSSTTTTTAPAGTTAAASTTAAATATTAATAAGTATDTGGAKASATPAGTGGAPATMPGLPPGTIAVADYYIVPAGVQLQAAALFTRNITQTIPSGDTTTWYTYTGGQWTSLGPATVFGGTPSIAQGSFSPVPTNLVVLASSQ
jgi:hypothetical protein